jgi:hypothetical protein
LGGDPSPAQQAAAKRHLRVLDGEAAHLIAVAGTESTYEVDLRPLNGSGAVGSATLVESEGKVGMRGTFSGLSTGAEHAIAIHALPPGQGRSVCPPRNAAAGSDHVLSAPEAEDFYGRPAVGLGSVPGGDSRHSASYSAPAGGSPPLDVRALVISGGSSNGASGADLPIACGVPAVAEARAGVSSSTELVAGVNQTRAAGVEIAAVVGDPTSATAAAARREAAARLNSAADHLGVANHIAVQELREAGEVSAEDRQAAARAKAALGGSQVVVSGGFAKLEKEVARERREERRRLAQRRVAQEAIRTASEEANPAPSPEPSPEPEVAPEPEPESAPAPAPSAPEGPTIVSP